MNRRSKTSKAHPLKLTKETIVRLTDDRLKAAAGGGELIADSGISHCFPCGTTTLLGGG